MTNKSVLALVATKSGVFQNGLIAVMTTISQISAVLVAEDANSTVRMIEIHRPALIILDMSIPESKDVIRQVKAQSPHNHLIVLVEDVAQQKEAEASGVDSALIKGCSAKQLIAIVENIINNREDIPNQPGTERRAA